jgi:hypothetical protein
LLGAPHQDVDFHATTTTIYHISQHNYIESWF